MPVPSATDGLLEAKLLVPRPRRWEVHRTRVLRRLRAARDERIVSVLAPPGYGKTTVLAQWASSDPRSVAWLTADHGDDDPEVLLSYLAAAIGRIEPLDPDIFRAIHRPSVSGRAIVGRLLTALQHRDGPILLVIDDAHRITGQASLDILAEFITYLPSPSQVVIGSREPVALPFARWRAEGLLLEIGPADLTMTEPEAARLARHLGLGASPPVIGRLLARTEGWPALLALTAVAVGRAPDPQLALAAADLPIADYLRSELLEGRSDEEIRFLTRTSILERLTGPVCDAVVGTDGSAERLARLARSTLLVDDYAGSYRYHSLLRDFLRHELATREPGVVAGLHARAAGWYTAAGAIDVAADHAFESRDLDLAATIVGAAMRRYHWTGRRATTRGWFRRFSDAALAERPWLAILAAWEEMGAGDLTATDHLADIVDDAAFDGRPPDGTASFESGRAMLRAAMSRHGADDALADAERCVELEPPGSPWRDFALWQLAIQRRVQGDRPGSEAALIEAIADARSRGNHGLGYCLVGHRTLLATERGDWMAAAAYAAESEPLRVAANVEGYLSTAPAQAARIRIAIHRGDIAEARRDLAASMNLRPLLTSACPALAVESLIAFAHAHLALGDHAGARTALAQARQVTRVRPDLGVLPGELAVLHETLAAMPFTMTGASSLTAAELRVLALLPYYLSFKEIAQRLGVKATTVKTHALAIYGKLGASTRGEAVEIAVEAGLLEPFFS